MTEQGEKTATVLPCNGGSCNRADGGQLREEIKRLLEGHPKITIRESSCNRNCSNAPSVMVWNAVNGKYSGTDYYSTRGRKFLFWKYNLKPKDIAENIKKSVR